MALSSCSILSRGAEVARSRPLTAPAAPVMRMQRPSTPVTCSLDGGNATAQRRGSKAAAAASLVAASVAAAGVMFPLGASLAAPASPAAAALVMQASAAEAPEQLGLPLGKAPALALLAEDTGAEALSPEERARQVLAEFKRKKAEAEAAKAAAAAAAAEQAEAARAAAAAAAAPPAKPEPSPSFFGSPPAQVEKSQPAPSAPPAQSKSAEKKTRTHGYMPAFVAQLGILAAYSGVVAATFLIPESQWKLVNEKLELASEKLIPVLDDAWVKAKPALEQAQVKGQELIVEAKPYVSQAVEAATPVVAKAVEQAKPLVAQAKDTIVGKVTEVLNKKDEEAAEAPALSKTQSKV